MKTPPSQLIPPLRMLTLENSTWLPLYLLFLLLAELSFAQSGPPPAGIPSAIPVAPAIGTRQPISPTWLATPPSYRLSPNDVLHIRIFQEEELETSARIAKNGSIPFPLIGTVILGGHTVPEATSILEGALREYLTHPQAVIRIVEYSKRKFTVLGQVSRPGTYDFPDDSPLTLLEGIGMAGGYTRIANSSKITIKRLTPNGEQVFRLDGKKMARDKDVTPFPLAPGDTVVIEESLF